MQMENNPKILVVDDDQLISNLIEKILDGTGYEVQKAYDGEEALQKVDQETPDLVILDVMMPKIDGLEVCRRLKANEKTRMIPVIMLTSRDYVEDKIEGLEHGAIDYVTKPFNSKELLARVKSLVGSQRFIFQKAEEEKMAALEKMLESVAHEVRNPIVTIGGFARRIRDRLPEESVIRAYSDHILQEVYRLETMLKEIIKLKTIVVELTESMDVAEIIETALGEFRESLDSKKISVEKKYSDPVCTALVDRYNLKIAFANIIKNAIEAMDERGHLEIERVCEGENVMIRFTDSGVGIHSEEIPEVIRPFYTSKMTGAGMGLTMVKHIVVLHDGDMRIASKKGEWTQVSIVLPLSRVSRDDRVTTAC